MQPFEKEKIMDRLFDFGIEIILFLQGLGAWLDAPMQFFSFLGNEEFFLLVMPAFYWCVSSAIGLRLGLLLLFSSNLNSIFKLVFHSPRPFWYSTHLRVLVSESSFGIPSGHAQNAAAVWGGLATSYKRTWVWITMLLVIFLIGISRLYVGVHFPRDVIVGWLLGALILVAYLALEKPVKTWWDRNNFPVRISTAFLVSLVLIVLGVLAKASLGTWTIPTLWFENAALASPAGELGDPLALAGIIGYSGALFGLILGASLLPLFGGFDAGGEYWKRGVRYIIGVIGVLLIWRGLALLFPGGENLLAFVLRYIRYALIGAWISGIAPLLFIRFGLASGLPELQGAGKEVRPSLST
jgi:membrane-associated phospholipid phosphatase